MRDPIPGPAVWPPTVEYRRDPASTARHLRALREVLGEPDPELQPPSRGVVWVGGGRYWPGVVAGVRLLREVGCTLPVEVWHRGTCEPVDAAQVAGLGVLILDADAAASTLGDSRIPTGDPYNGGWETKLYALTHTRFDQVLFLDADAYCVRDPAPLFGLLSPAEPFAFWEDLPRMESCVKWDRVWPGGSAGVPRVQGGQLLLDRRHGAKLLRVAHWLCQHSDYYFCWMYGDQDAWRVALAAGASGYRSLGAADWQAPAFVCSWRNLAYIVHRCQGKLFPEDRPEPFPHLPSEDAIFRHLETITG